MLIINAKIRKKKGKAVSRRLRKNYKLPAIIYGNNQKPILIELNNYEILNKEINIYLYKILTLLINGKKTKVKIQDIQYHPFKPKLTHIDFLFI
ncbi:MAG: 50S ribosomal protein L25 [Arsenophonus endosymbiont of Ceratovacuna japonica]